MKREPLAPPGMDAYAPAEIAQRIEDAGVAKARQPWLATAMLGALGGAFIALGALWYTLVASDASLGFAASRLLGGVVFPLGLILVVVAGAELFTGNNLLVMAWAERRITARELTRKWAIVLAANAVGAVAMAWLAVWSGYVELNGGAVARTAVANFYFITLGLLLRDTVDAAAVPGVAALDWTAYWRNLVPVTLGNIVGGSGFVALVYHVIYRLAPRR